MPDEPTPVVEPVVDPAQPEPTPEPPRDELADLVDRLASFDPAEIIRRLDILEGSGEGDPGEAIRSALTPFFEDVGAALHETVEAVRGLVAAPKPKPRKDPPEPPVGDPPAPSPRTPAAGRGLLDRLFETPVI